MQGKIQLGECIRLEDHNLEPIRELNIPLGKLQLELITSQY